MKYRTVATGGTFDHFHKGHAALLTRSFEVGETVIIGITSDEFAAKLGKTPGESFEERAAAVKAFIASSFPGRNYRIAKLYDYFGPGIASPEVEAIVVTQETAARISVANALRAEKGYSPLKVEMVEYVLAGDKKPISSTRIRSGEIDPQGRLLKGSGKK